MGEGSAKRRQRPLASRKLRRVHGLQFPLHPQQLIAWITMSAFISFTYGAIVPALHSSLAMPFGIIAGILFSLHIITQFVALALDPADPHLRARKHRLEVPEFDKDLHSHVIENGRCHLCNITISSNRTKHCSACNKCVEIFDHHCKWLNHCIGKRNYKMFIASVITAILSCLLIMSACLAEIVLKYYNRDNIAPLQRLKMQGIKPLTLQKNKMESPTVDEFESTLTCTAGAPYCHFAVFGARIYDGAFIGLLSCIFSIALVVEVLLIHLAAFHAYINCLGLTTYEYIRGSGIPEAPRHPPNNGTFPTEEPQGAFCGWRIIKSSANNQITPSSTTDTALFSTNSHDSSHSNNIGNNSPRSFSYTASPSSSNDSIKNSFVKHLPQSQTPNKSSDTSVKNTITPSPKSSLRSTSTNLSNVPTLPQITKSSVGKKHNALQTLKAVSTADHPIDKGLEVRLVSIPRPKPRRKIRSSIVPHLSPIKECDLSTSSPPSLKDLKSDSPAKCDDGYKPGQINGSKYKTKYNQCTFPKYSQFTLNSSVKSSYPNVPTFSSSSLPSTGNIFVVNDCQSPLKSSTQNYDLNNSEIKNNSLLRSGIPNSAHSCSSGEEPSQGSERTCAKTFEVNESKVQSDASSALASKLFEKNHFGRTTMPRTDHNSKVSQAQNGSVHVELHMRHREHSCSNSSKLDFL